MLPAETLHTLTDLERRYPVDTWQVAGLPAWPVLRLHLGFSLLARDRPIRLGRATPRFRAAEVVELGKVARAALRDPAGTRFSPRRADVLFLSQPGNRTRVGGGFMDRYFDPLADLLEARGRSSLLLEYHDVDVDYRLPRRRPALLIRPRVSIEQARAVLRCRLRVPSPPPGYAELAREIQTRHGITPLTPARLAERLVAIEYTARYFGHVLDVVRPRAVLVSCYYSMVGLALCLGARRRRILSVDMQHGVTARNPAYDGWTRAPAGGYSLLPDRFWTWSEADAEAARRSSLQVIVGGNPFDTFWEGEHPEARRLKGEVEALRRSPPNVLIALSNTSGLSPILRRVVETAPRDFTFWVRLHPLLGRDREEIIRWARSVRGPAVRVEGPTDLPLPLLLRRADVLLAHSSTVLAEAAAVGLPSVAVDRAALDSFAEHVDSGLVTLAEGDDVLPALLAQARRGEARREVGVARCPTREDVERTLTGLLGGT